MGIKGNNPIPKSQGLSKNYKKPISTGTGIVIKQGEKKRRTYYSNGAERGAGGGGGHGYRRGAPVEEEGEGYLFIINGQNWVWERDFLLGTRTKMKLGH